MIKVLLVEDEEIIRRLLVYTIDWMSMGCTVSGEAGNGKEGLELIEKLEPDIVVTDICMPELDGIQMLERGLERVSFQSILLTGYGEFEYARKAIALGSVDYILKPIDEEKFCIAVRRAVARVLEKRAYESVMRERARPELLAVNIEEKLQACDDYYVRRVLRYMQEHYRSHIRIEDLAEQMKISPGYLSKRFKAETSMTFGSALQHLRVQKAVSLIEGGDMKIYEVAEAVGYSNYKRFCEVFKQITKVTPTEYAAIQDRFRPAEEIRTNENTEE